MYLSFLLVYMHVPLYLTIFFVFLTGIPVFFTALYTRILMYLIRESINLTTLQMYFFKMAVSIPPVNISHA